MIDVLVGKIEISPGERIEIYLRTVRGQRVVSFETVSGGEASSESGTKIAVAHLGKLQPLLV
jgi:hypothetical protein